MLRLLFHHYTLNLKRSQFFEGTLIIKILKSLFKIVIIGYGLCIGLFVDFIISKVAPDTPLSVSLTYMSVVYFAYIALLQLYMLHSRADYIIPYHCLPIKRSKLMIFGTLLQTPSALDYFSFALYVVIFGKFAYLGVIGVADVVLYSLLALFVSVVVSETTRLLKTLRSIVVMAVYFVGIAALALYSFRIDISPIAVLLDNRYVALALVVALPALLIPLLCWQYKISFYKQTEGTAKKVKAVSTTIGKVKYMSPYVRLLVILFVRHKTFIIYMLSMTLLFVMNYLAYLKQNETSFMVPFYAMCLFYVLMLVHAPILQLMSHYIDGLYVGNTMFVKKMLLAGFRTCAMIAFVMATICAVASGNYLLTFSLYVWAIGVGGFVSAFVNKFALKRIDLVNRNKKMEFNSLPVTLICISAFALFMLMSLLYGQIDNQWYCAILIGVGLPLVLTHKMWINAIFKSFMSRRYLNLSSLRGDA